MNLNKHFEIEGKHAILGASKWRWINYSEEEMRNAYLNSFAQEIGTAVHEFAKKYINNRTKLTKGMKNCLGVDIRAYNKYHPIPNEAIDLDFIFPNLMTYVNDAVGFGMVAEQPLKFSDYCFGTADALSFNNDILRIHDLKTGKTPAHIEQLEIYAALFCLEYRINPKDIDIFLRIYQSNEVLCHDASAEDIADIMDIITEHNDLIMNIY